MAQDSDVTSAPLCKVMVLFLVLPPLVWIAIFLLPVLMVPDTSRVLSAPSIRIVLPCMVTPLSITILQLVALLVVAIAAFAFSLTTNFRYRFLSYPSK